MKKIRFYWVVIVLIMAIALVGVGLIALSWWSQDEDKSSLVPPLEPALDAPKLELPSLPLTPKTMTDEQRQAAVEMAAEGARQAALASGQSESQALQAAEDARIQAQRIFYPSRPQP